MIQIRHKTIARLLIMLMLMTPLTGMAMQWTAQSSDMNHCHDMQKVQPVQKQLLQHNCQMNTDCQKMCNSIQHCSSSTLSILIDASLVFKTEVHSHLFSPDQSIQFALIQSELFRPPRA
jgi:hypothetical protein